MYLDNGAVVRFRPKTFAVTPTPDGSVKSYSASGLMRVVPMHVNPQRIDAVVIVWPWWWIAWLTAKDWFTKEVK